MARAGKVSREEARKAALSAFWTNGYSALGVRKLEEATGINRFMLQTVFGGKAGLFIELLDDYLAMSKDTMFDPLAEGDLDAIAASFLMRASDELPPETASGCLIINTLCEEDTNNAEINKRITGYFDLLRDNFRGALNREKDKGSLVDNLDIEQTCEFLLSSIIGINVLVKAKGNNSAALPSATMMANIIMGWRKIG